MPGYLASVTAGISSSFINSGGADADGEESRDPLLDMSGQEELEVPFLTLATSGSTGLPSEEDMDLDEGGGGEDTVSLLLLETRAHTQDLEGMLATGIDGCKNVRAQMRQAVKAHGKRILKAESSAGLGVGSGRRSDVPMMA